MKISIITKDRPKKMVFHLPLFLIKAKFVSKMICKYTQLDEEIYNLQQKIKSCYKQLKHFIRINGHFNIVEVYDNDGDIVIIRV